MVPTHISSVPFLACWFCLLGFNTGFTSQYNYQQPTPVSGADPHQYQPYQQYQQYYQQYPVYQQPPPQYQQPAVDTQTAGQYQQPPTETQAQPQGQYQHPPPETHPQPAKQEKKEQQDETKGQLIIRNSHCSSKILICFSLKLRHACLRINNFCTPWIRKKVARTVFDKSFIIANDSKVISWQSLSIS